MSSSGDYRADKSGFAREVQEKLAGKYDGAEAAKALHWLSQLKPQVSLTEPFTEAVAKLPQGAQQSVTQDELHKSLFDGFVLGHTMASLKGDAVNPNNKAWQPSASPTFETSRQRERIGLFLKFATEYGVNASSTFQTDQLFEKTNLGQVVICLAQLGTEAQSKPDYHGPQGMWMQKHQENRRDFTEEQRRAGDSVIGLQMGTNKGANASGVSFGAQRRINDSH